MKNRNFVDYCKNAVGTVFLLAAAFFVCSTLVSMRAVLADPIAPVDVVTPMGTPSTARATATSRVSRANPRGTTTSSSRGTTARPTTTARTAVAPTAVNAATTATTVSRSATSRTTPVASRSSGGVSTRTTTTSRGNAAQVTTPTSSRGVTARSATVSNRSDAATAARSVRARTATVAGTANTARVSLQGAAIRGSKATSGNSYQYLSSKLYTGNYSNIIDSTTGMISAEAYSNCMESYYTCMDEICTVRNEAQGRCSCAARTKSFAAAEQALESANEELIRASGELALFIATKGKDVSAAFQLTDAEKIMNCAAYQEARTSGTVDDWCKKHPEISNNELVECNKSTPPTYCSKMSSTYGFNLTDLGGSGSDILTQLKSAVEAKEKAAGMSVNNGQSILDGVNEMLGALNGLGVANGTLTDENASSLDKLANTWGYDLFKYAHNEVCSRVLDSCFNGIYEACGTPPSGFKCANGSTSACPYNYNSKITVQSNGEITLQERGTTGTTNNASAACFGYTSTSGDPYSSLRGPVADARRSIMNKYMLDANAACDVFGEQLRTTAQNVTYQKVAVQQALQQKRLEFAQEETANIAKEYQTAIGNFNKCLDEIYDCYEKQNTTNTSWSTSRIKTYCAQVSNAPSCYETMVCDAPNSNLLAVITRLPKNKSDANAQAAGSEYDRMACENTTDYKTNTCRNVITISEVLSGAYAAGADANTPAGMREQCLQNHGIDGIRNWASSNTGGGWSTQTCPNGQHLEGTSCVPDVKSCVHSDANAATATQTWNASTQSFGGCTIVTCKTGYTLNGGMCVQG